MRSLSRSTMLGLLAVASALGVGCSPLDQDPAAVQQPEAPKISSKEMKATIAQYNTAATNAVGYLLNDANAWINQNGCAACHRATPLLAASIAYKNGLTVNTSILDWLGSYEAAEQTRYTASNPGVTNFWCYDPGSHLSKSKSGFEHWAMQAYNNSRSNAYQAQLATAIPWLQNPTQRASNGTTQAYGTTDPNGAQYAWWVQDYDSTLSTSRDASDHWTYTFANDGLAYANTSQQFLPGDYQSAPVSNFWQQPTGEHVAAISLHLSTNQGLTAAQRTSYTATRDTFTNALEGAWVRKGSGYGVHRTFYSLLGMINAGRTTALNANTQAMVNRLLALKPAGVAGWGDPENGVGANGIVPTGEALYGLCLAGVRLDQFPEAKNALDWLVSQQLSSGCVLGNPTVGTQGGCFPSTTGTYDVPSTYATLALSCYGVLNVTISASNVAPADPGAAGAALLAPGAASTQTVTFKVNIFNNGYDVNAFALAASGGYSGNGGTTLSLSTASLSVSPNATGTATVTAVYPANLPLSTQAPITINVKYTGPSGQVSSNITVPVNIGSQVDPNQALATNTVLTSSVASATIGTSITLTATMRANVNNALVPGGSVTFSGPGFSQTVPSNGAGVATYAWNTSNAVAGLQAISALFGGYNSGVAGQSQYASSSNSVQVTLTAPPPPPAPGISGPANGYSSTDGNVTVTGSSVAGVTVTVRTAAGGNLGSVTVPAGGAYSIPLSLVPGVYTINAIATNAGGNSPASTTITITINPLAPVITTPAANLTTANGTVAMVGTGYPGATVTVKDGATTVGTFTVDAAGNWSGNVALALGAHVLSVTQAFSGATSAATTRSVGILTPAPAISTPAAGAALPNGNNAITGTCTASATITIYDNGVTTGVTGLCAANGTYNITVNLGYGSHVLTATSTNGAGESAQSAGRTVSVAPGAPVITTPVAVSSDITGPFTFAGTGVPGATVRIYDNGVEINNQVIAANGTFSFTVNAPTLGGHNLTATQTSNGQTSPASAAKTITVHNDTDGDTIYDEIDNCIMIWNKDQVDRDSDGVGDVCDKAPGQTDASNNTTSATDASLTSDPSADTNLLAANQNNLLTVPAGAWAGRNTLTLVNIPANNSGNIEIWGKASPSVAAWTKMTSYDAQLGPSHPATLANGLAADVAVTTPRTSLANYANRYKQFQVRVKEADGSITTIPHCASGTTASATDDRCVNSAIAYTLIDGTNVDAGIKLIFKMKAF